MGSARASILIEGSHTRRGLSRASDNRYESADFCVRVFGVQLKLRDAFENEGVRLENQEMFVAILTHCESRSELIREMAK